MLNSEEIAEKYRQKTGKDAHFTTVNEWLNSGKIPARKIGGKWFAEEEVVDAFLSGEKK